VKSIGTAVAATANVPARIARLSAAIVALRPLVHVRIGSMPPDQRIGAIAIALEIRTGFD
jgi:hypothetical protein